MKTQLDEVNLTIHKLGNLFHSILLLVAMMFVLSLLGWLFAGSSGMKWVLIFAPLLTVFLQPALSRTREFDADLGAAALTGDPQGLASALAKMERYKGGLLTRIFLSDHREPHPSVLRTHPQTEERIKRLLSLSKQKPEISPLPHILEENISKSNIPEHMVQIRNNPRWRIGGIWY